MYKQISSPNKHDITLVPIQDHKKSVIWLHGFGDSAYGWVDTFNSQELNPFGFSTKIILLTAPLRHDQQNPGFPMNSWFRFDSNQINSEDIEEIKNEIEGRRYDIHLQQLLNDDPSQIYIGGFSQGAIIATLCALAFKKPLGGGISICALVLPEPFIDHGQQPKLPIFCRIGKHDQVFPPSVQEASWNKLQKFNNVDCKMGEFGHELTRQTLSELKLWMQKLYQN